MYRRNEAVQLAAEGQAGTLLDLERGKYYGLDEIGLRIWEFLSVPRSGAAIVDLLKADYDVRADELERDVNRFIHDLSRKGLVQTVE